MKTLFVSTLFVFVSGHIACGKGADGPGAPAAAPAPGGEAAAKVEHPPLVLAYDALREALAIDDLELAKKKAKELAAIAGAPEKLVAVANDFEKMPNFETARVAFGEISRAYITHLAANPDMAKGLITFRCPMAEVYQLWVQTSEPMRNPYMGKRMLECGSKVELAP